MNRRGTGLIEAVVASALTALFLSSCNTMSGLGRDMQKAGSSLENTANKPSN